MVSLGNVKDAVAAGVLTPEFIQTAPLKLLIEKCTDPKSPPDVLDYY